MTLFRKWLLLACQARERKAESLLNEQRLEADLETLKRALAHEERRLQVLEQKHKTLEEGLYVDDAEPAGYFVWWVSVFNPSSLSSPRRFRVHFICHRRAAISYLDPYVLLIAVHS